MMDLLAGYTFFCKSRAKRESNMSAMVDIPTEPDLAMQFRRGDDSAFDRIVERHSAEVAALANRLLGWPGEVDDVVQEVFIAAFLGLRKFRGQCRLRTWLFTIAVNKCRSLRFRRRRPLSFASVDDPEAVVGSDPSGDKAAMDQETFARVRRAVQALPRKYREVIVMKYLQGLETGEACELLGLTVNAMQVRLNRARAKLKEQLGDLFQEKS
jgi:RNA polymerase sigma factor (sigma-70 family)